MSVCRNYITGILRTRTDWKATTCRFFWAKPEELDTEKKKTKKRCSVVAKLMRDAVY